MVIASLNDFDVIEIRRSDRKQKKYMSLVRDKKTGNLEYVWFGSSSYPQYRDSTDLKLYSHLDHLDKSRKKRFHARHKNNNGVSATLSKYFLWR